MQEKAIQHSRDASRTATLTRSQTGTSSRHVSSNALARAKSILVSKAIQVGDERRRKAAEWVLEPASSLLIVEIVKKMQALKGRSYSEVAERMYGEACDQDMREFVERQICEMMHEKQITVSELTEWYRLTIETVYEHSKFQPLPDFSACVKAVEAAQVSNRRLREAAERVFDSRPVIPGLIAATAEQSGAKTMPELFAELRKKLG